VTMHLAHSKTRLGSLRAARLVPSNPMDMMATMFRRPLEPTLPVRGLRWVRGKRWALGLWLGLGLSGLGLAQAKDQVTYYNPRSERVITIGGVVEANDLAGVTVKTGEDSTAKVDADQVLRITWGDVPQSFHDGRTYLDRKDFENALLQFRLAASDSDSRPVVKAAARMSAAGCLLNLGAKDPARLQECADEAQRFLDEFPNGRSVPEAMALKARALWIEGKPQEAMDAFLALYDKGQAKTPGFSPVLCLEAGMNAAWTSLELKNTGKARELFASCQPGFEALAKDAPAAERARLDGLAATASTGEGFCLLTSGDARGAKAFFERMIARTELAPAGKFSATLGLGEALLADGAAAEAQIHLARVSALDPSGRDRTARAMFGLAKALKAAGGNKASQAQVAVLLAKLKSAYGDTPTAFYAAKWN